MEVIEIAGLGIRVSHHPKAQKLSPWYDGFRASDFQFELTAMADLPAVKRAPRARASLSGRQLTIQDDTWYLLEADLQEGHGTVRFAERELPNWQGPEPLGLHAALKSFVAVWLAMNGGMLIHAAGVQTKRGAVALLGKSGAGKSTISAMFPANSVLSDELVAIAVSNGRTSLHSTPFAGDLYVPRVGQSASLLRILALEKSGSDRIDTISQSEALSLLMNCVALPKGLETVEKLAFQSANELLRTIPLGRLQFSMNPERVLATIDRTV